MVETYSRSHAIVDGVKLVLGSIEFDDTVELKCFY